MTPRRPTSSAKNKTNLPAASLTLMRESFIESFPEFLKDKEVLSEGWLYLDEIIVRIGFREKGALRQLNFDCSMDFDMQTQNPMDLIYVGIDAIESMMTQYTETEGDIEFPRDWLQFQFEGKTVWLKSSTENSELEAQANALLGEDFLEDQLQIDENYVDELFDKLRSGELKH